MLLKFIRWREYFFMHVQPFLSFFGIWLYHSIHTGIHYALERCISCDIFRFYAVKLQFFEVLRWRLHQCPRITCYSVSCFELEHAELIIETAVQCASSDDSLSLFCWPWHFCPFNTIKVTTYLNNCQKYYKMGKKDKKPLNRYISSKLFFNSYFSRLRKLIRKENTFSNSI